MSENTRVIYCDLPYSVRGFVKKTEDEFYYIVLNSRLNCEQNQSTLHHELKHIERRDIEKECNIQQLEFVRHL